MLELNKPTYRPSSLFGKGVSDSNLRLRFLLISFAGIVALASVLYWRSQLLLSQEFVSSPEVHHKISDKVIQPLNDEQ